MTQNPQGPYQPGQPGGFPPPGQGGPHGQGGPQQPYGQQPPYGQQQPYGQQPYGGPQQRPGTGPNIPDPPAFAQKFSGIGANWGTGAGRPTMPTPKSVTWAFLLAAGGSLVTAAYYLIYAIAFTSYWGVFYNGGMTVFGILIAAAVFVIAVMMRNGAEWARIVLAILSGLGALFGLIGLFSVGMLFTVMGGFGALLLVFLILEVATLGGTLYFLFQPDANAYFKSAAGPGHGYPPPPPGPGPQHFGG